MPLYKLLAIEAALVIGAALYAVVIFASPFGSSDGARPTGDAAGALAADQGTHLLAAATATPQPNPTRDTCGPPVDRDFLSANQIVSYYGNPYVPAMGILGELAPDELVAEVKAKAAAYDALNGSRGVQPALHLVYGTAQHDPGRKGTYLLYMDDDTLKQYIDLACKNHLFIFLDMQIGRSNVRDEIAKILPRLKQSHVQVAIDPEFAMPEGEVPGESIGTLDADQINDAQQLIEDYVGANGLPDKILVVHQFQESMVTRRELIKRYPHVRLVMDMDGYGPAEIKRVKFGWYAAPEPYSGIKLFFKHDPDLMSEQDVLSLNPNVIIYQ